MRLPALALTARALRTDARSLRISLLRTATVLILICVLGASLSSSRFFGAPGLRLFSWLLDINFFLLTFVAVTMFPMVIVEEKEQRTLGLLQLAGFNPCLVPVRVSGGKP